MKSRTRRIIRRGGVIAGLALALGAVTAFLVIEHRPSWYAPAALDESGIQSSRRDATNSVDRFGDELVQGSPFEWTLEDQAINSWLTAMPYIWPEAARAIPPEWRDPAVRFEPGFVRVAVLFDSRGWRAILSVAISVSVLDDGRSIEVRLREARCGSMPIPRWLLEMLVDSRLDQATGAMKKTLTGSSSAQQIQSIGELFEGVRVRNRFVWPNGRRSFRLNAIHPEVRHLTLQVEPLQ